MTQKLLNPILANVCASCRGYREPRGSSKTICQPCYRREHLKNRPKWYDDQLKRSNKSKKDAVRIKRKLPLDHPRCIAIKGEGHNNCAGYRTIYKPGHPNAKGKGHIGEHVFIMSQYLGRALRKGETVHHKNGIRNDNRIENLELWDKTHPPGQRVEDKISFYKAFLEKHGYIVEKK